MPSTVGTIAVLYVNDLIHEIRNAVHSAHCARTRGRPYGPVELSDSVVRVTITYADNDDKPSERSKRAAVK